VWLGLFPLNRYRLRLPERWENATLVSFSELEGGSAPHLEINMKTFSAKAETFQHDWYVVDGTNAVLGRLATSLAHHLRGKHKAEFTPHVDTGDFIVVVNAEKIRVTGNKIEDKRYFRHSGYPGGISETTFGKMQEKFPGRALEIAVKGMLPKGPLGYAMLKKLKIYAGESHPHSAQQPKPLAV
jgi:large subunit ribosomal protein L13